MSAGGLLLGLINVAIYCAIIILVAFIILWLLNMFGVTPSGEVIKWGKIVVALLCLAAIVAFLLSAISGVAYTGPHFFRT